ncbi:MAG: alkaline phosphatase family protein [Anaerolineae bacterium]|nr:alkaline phosphatase family protein [Anaerolineae bacterium]
MPPILSSLCYKSNMPPPSAPQRQRFTPSARYWPKPFAQKLTILLIAALAILVQGCALVPASPLSSTPGEATAVSSEAVEEVAHLNPDEVYQPVPVPEATAKPKRSKPMPPQSMLIPTPLTLPQATMPPEPTPTATRVIIDTPTFTPTPLPTATGLPPDPPPPAPIVEEIPTETPPPEPGIKYVVLISIDGLRPDALALAHTPTLDELIKQGAFTPTGQTIVQSFTLPSHASMLTGVVAEKHGLLDSLPYIGWPGLKVPTLFNIAHDAGLTTGMVFGKEKLNYLVWGDSVDNLYGTDGYDELVKEEAVKLIGQGLPNVLFIHFPDVDRAGHEIGWMSEHQLNTVVYVDKLIGEVVAELKNNGYWPNTLLIVTADHGGHGQRHGDDSPVDRTIPWLAVGPDVPKGITMGHINIYDTTATVLYALDVPIPEYFDGRPVMEIFPQTN